MSEMIKSVSIVDAIENHLKKMIIEEEFEPGERLPSERELQENLGVSRLPLREAMARLEALGMIKIRHGKGTYVVDKVCKNALRDVLIAFFPARDTARLRELVEARGLLESEISALATKYSSEEDLERLEEVVKSSSEAIDDGELFADLDYTFHHEISKLAQNSFLLLMHEALGPHIRSFISTTVNSDEQRQMAHERNKDLLNAIKSGDPKLAATKAREHLQACLKRIVPTSNAS